MVNVLEKDYMLTRTEERLGELKHRYYLTCQCITVDGEVASANGSASRRSKIKKDICAIVLVQDLLKACNAKGIALTTDALLGFERLIGG